MTASKKIKPPLDLEGLFAKRKDKEKRYTPLKLTAADLKKIHLTKPTDSELETALPPFLGNNLMLAYKGKTLCLTEKMSEEEWERLVGEEKTAILKRNLEQHKSKEKKSYVLLKLKAPELKEFGFEKATPVPSAAVLEEAVTPFLCSELILFKKKPKTKTGKETLYLAYNLPQEEFVREAFFTQNLKKPFSLEKIAADVPLNKTEFVDLFSRMLETGRLKVKVDDKFKIVRVQFSSEQTPPVLPQGQGDDELFRTVCVPTSPMPGVILSRLGTQPMSGGRKWKHLAETSLFLTNRRRFVGMVWYHFR